MTGEEVPCDEKGGTRKEVVAREEGRERTWGGGIRWGGLCTETFIWERVKDPDTIRHTFDVRRTQKTRELYTDQVIFTRRSHFLGGLWVFSFCFRVVIKYN